jgi:hypothetical protein
MFLGIDYNHPALGGGFGEGFKVRYGKNLVSSSNDKANGIKSLGEDDPFDPCKHNDAGMFCYCLNCNMN